MRFVKKPIVIEAWEIRSLCKAAENHWKDLPEKVADEYEYGNLIFRNDGISIKTLEGWMMGNLTDYLICGIKGEFYPCKPDIFEATYDQLFE